MEGKIYEPNEDSYFMIDCLDKLLEKRELKKVLEIGTGSGIVAFKIADKIEKILAVDINPEAIKIAEKERKILGIENIEFRESDLFEKVEEKFDLVFFNPPYLPGEEDVRWSGGEKGQEVIEKFLSQVRKYLKEGGVAMILLSSFNEVEKLRESYGLEKFEEKKLWFETLYCYILK